MGNDPRSVFEAQKITTLTFDCYGTLVDWEAGACKALRNVYGFSTSAVSDDKLIDLFLEADARLVRSHVFPYRAVLSRAARSVADKLQVSSRPDQEASFASSVPSWPLFAETRPCLAWLAQRYRLDIVFNIEHDVLFSSF